MIKMHGTRKRGPEFFTDMPALHETTTEMALESLIKAELRFGGHIIELTPTRVVVQTQVLACLDTTYFEGSEEEMADLVAVAYYYTKAQAEQRDGIVEECADKLGQMPESTRGNAFFVTTLAPMIMGNTTLKRALELMQQAQE